ncbi:thiopurine S-methyltransferase [Aquipseudomonas alcaligenes]|uniref:Thiopurine S-methyltransferase n=1 Tax=Aquipseudomonas alcaligenes (strain ATCC 14909 / DSM 50342 / CCUG 1425 / JCM 20561 / NBRC 14159 / NCIMB 9945 / NCTC 10367 / 1577) TaxID=1215092 RepID=U3B1T6_AQUA1|nr:thiopurine S-methyltransferase [Pseudomonas alcaligenes]GAD60888.1 thiopurine S-methyltransferase [Pseudomonas alcaligenes NBRC 14159]SUD13593.1 thiopurine S-methyltransferase [Pseudomonas alcaligenes]
MEHSFWHDRWATNQIGFHQPAANPLLVTHCAALALPSAGRVLLPLCGKTLDIAWLLAAGYQVVGVELSELAVQQLFAELGATPRIQVLNDALQRYETDKLTVFVGDIFALSREQLGPVDAIYDRAALVALPATLRSRYASHLTAISAGARQLLISFDYEQSQLPGPPFAVLAEELSELYGQHYELQALARQSLAGGLKGQCPADEAVWLLQPRA